MANLTDIFEQEYRALRPRAPMPEFHLEFRPFANVNSTIRLREGCVRARLSDLLQSAPESVLRAITHILLAKLYHKPIDRQHSARYRRYVSGRGLLGRAEQMRSLRGRKLIGSARGKVYDLDAIFDRLNQQHFHGLMARPQMTWSRDHAHASLGHYDPAHNAIVISRVFDSPRVPHFAVEYIVYHEMLHLRHPVKVRNGRRCVHPPEFQAEENLFPQLQQAQAFLKTL
ncbi:MAG: M48 family peptidase [Terriglobales bacterium]|jgi:predicted metal-dependent hydrolase